MAMVEDDEMAEVSIPGFVMLQIHQPTNHQLVNQSPTLPTRPDQTDRPNDRTTDRTNERTDGRTGGRTTERPNERTNDRPNERPSERPNDKTNQPTNQSPPKQQPAKHLQNKQPRCHICCSRHFTAHTFLYMYPVNWSASPPGSCPTLPRCSAAPPSCRTPCFLSRLQLLWMQQIAATDTEQQTRQVPS